MAKIKDERLDKLEYKLAAPLFLVYTFLYTVATILYITLELSNILVILNISIITIVIGFYIIANLISGTLFAKKTDEYVTETKNNISSIAAIIYFIYLLVPMIYSATLPEHDKNTEIITIIYVLIFIIPFPYLLYTANKHGIFEAEKYKLHKRGIKRALKVHLIQTITCSVFMCSVFMYFLINDFKFTLNIYAFIYSIIFAVLVYFIGYFSIKRKFRKLETKPNKDW